MTNNLWCGNTVIKISLKNLEHLFNHVITDICKLPETHMPMQTALID